MTYEVGSRYPKLGDKVRIVQKINYSNGELTEGVVKDVLTGKKFHSRGHKVRLTNGIIGRIQDFVDMDGQKQITEIPEKDTPPYILSEDDLV